MKRATIVFLVLVALLLLGIVGVVISSRGGKKEAKSELAEIEVPVVVDEVKLGDIEDVIELYGYIEPSSEVNVISKVSGKLIRNVVEEGDEVRKDQVIAYVNQDIPGVRFKHYPVESPVRGVVAKLLFDPGAMVSPQFPIATVVDIDKVRVKTSVIEKDYARLQLGQLARVYNDAYPGKWFKGKLIKIAPVLDQLSHTAEVEIEIENPGHLLRPGMFVRIELVVDKHQKVPIVPKTAVLRRLGKNIIYIVEEGIARKREVKLGYYDLYNYEILEGVKPGELFVAQEQAVLQDGVRVRIARNLAQQPLEKEEGGK